jgi:hypothetical protein
MISPARKFLINKITIMISLLIHKMNRTLQSPVTGRHAPAQGAAAKVRQIPFRRPKPQRKCREAHVNVEQKTSRGFETVDKYAVEYITVSELFRRMFNYFSNERFLGNNIKLLVRTNFSTFYWNHELACRCFVGNAITIQQLITEMAFGKVLNTRRAAV